MLKKIFLEEKHNIHFWEKGYIVIQLLDENEAKNILNDLQQLSPHDKYAPDNSGRSNYHCTFLDSNIEYRKQANCLVEKYFTNALENTLNEYSILTANFYVKQPGKGKFEMHMNWHTSPSIQDVTLTAWCPLVPVNTTNGALKVVESSHKITFDVAHPYADYYFSDIESHLESHYFKTFDLKAGECVIFDDTLIHYSDNNLSDKPRIAVQIELVPKRIQPVLYVHESPQKTSTLEIYKVDSQFFINAPYQELIQMVKKQPCVGRLQNRNRKLTTSEFDQRMLHHLHYRDCIMKNDDSFLEKKGTKKKIGKMSKIFNNIRSVFTRSPTL